MAHKAAVDEVGDNVAEANFAGKRDITMGLAMWFVQGFEDLCRKGGREGFEAFFGVRCGGGCR